MRTVLLVMCGVGVAAVGGWLLAGGSLALPETLVDRLAPGTAATPAGTAPVHLDSTPSRAQVTIDGARAGWTPLDVRLVPGQHALGLQHPDALDQDQTLAIPESGANVSVTLWRRWADVVPLRPVYPGASLVDARFLDDGQVALLVSLPAQPGLGATRELWRLDPTTGQPSRVTAPGIEAPVATMVLEPDGQRVADVTPGSSSAVSASLWPASGRAPTGPQQASQPEAVWVAPVDGSRAPYRVFELPSASGPTASSDAERIIDLVWTQDGARLVVVTRQAGPPARARVVVLSVPAPGEADTQTVANELVLVPAEVVPGSSVPDPSGRWLAVVTHAAVAPGGSDLLSLCVLELRRDGAFRDLADLGSAARPPATAPMTWAPADSSPDRLVFVAPAPASPSGGGPFGLFGLFGALRAAAPPSGLFLANLAGADLAAVQPRRLGTLINTFGPVWRSESTLLGLARQDDGALALRSIDVTSGAVRDLGVRLPAGTGQGLGLSARWDTRHGRALVLARPSAAGTLGNAASGGPLQAWLVSFVSPSAADGAAH